MEVKYLQAGPLLAINLVISLINGLIKKGNWSLSPPYKRYLQLVTVSHLGTNSHLPSLKLTFSPLKMVSKRTKFGISEIPGGPHLQGLITLVSGRVTNRIHPGATTLSHAVALLPFFPKVNSPDLHYVTTVSVGWTGTSMDGCFIGILIMGLVVITI